MRHVQTITTTALVLMSHCGKSPLCVLTRPVIKVGHVRTSPLTSATGAPWTMNCPTKLVWRVCVHSLRLLWKEFQSRRSQWSTLASCICTWVSLWGGAWGSVCDHALYVVLNPWKPTGPQSKMAAVELLTLASAIMGLSNTHNSVTDCHTSLTRTIYSADENDPGTCCLQTCRDSANQNELRHSRM